MNTPPSAELPKQDSAACLNISIRELQIEDDATAFRALNEEWISHYFVLEDKDREQLGNPGNILNQGGHILMAVRDGERGSEYVGCVALIPMSPGVYELSKMAVLPQLRGLGIGRALLLHALAQAKSIGARSLFLGSNTKLANAVKLYESVGFRHVAAAKIPKLPYSRANVFMELDLG